MTIIWSLILVNVNSWALEKPVGMRYLSFMKSDSKKLLMRNSLVTKEHLNFNEHMTYVCKKASGKLNELSRVSSVLSYQRKGVSNSLVSQKFSYGPRIWMFSSIRFYRKINKLYERSLRLCQNDYTSSYDKLLSKQGLLNIHTRNPQQLMIFKCLRGQFPLLWMRYLCWEMSHKKSEWSC